MELATENPGVGYPANINWLTRGQWALRKLGDSQKLQLLPWQDNDVW
jgi:hypothetical protein